MHPIIFIVGPTCCGKTDLAFYLANRWQAKVLNADSLQVYQYMDIGTAKPPLHLRKTHELFDCVTPPDTWTAGRYEKSAFRILKKNLPQRLCLVVGGSGFYLQALEKGCYPVQKTDAKILNSLLKKSTQSLYQELIQKDAETCIHPNDRYRILRALAVSQSEGKSWSHVKEEFQARHWSQPLIKIGLTGSRDVLKKRVSLRIQNMMKLGLIEEVQGLLARGLQGFPPLQSVGYKEVQLFLENKISRENLETEIEKRTLQLIKKQKKWFQRDDSIRWYDCETDFSEIEQDLKLQQSVYHSKNGR